MKHTFADVVTRVAETVPAPARVVGDVLAGSVVLGTIAKILPAIAALVSIVWFLMQIFAWIEKRVQDRERKRRDKKE